MNKIIVYKSNTGFTEKYAKWIAEDLNCSAIPIEKINISNMVNCEIVIFGGGMHAGKINGINIIKNNLDLLKNKKLVIFATGGTPHIPKEIEKFKQNNIPPNLNISFYYFQSGMNYERMPFIDRLTMKLFNMFLKVKRNKSDIEKGTSNAINKSYDYSSREQIKPLVNFVQSILNSNENIINKSTT